MSRARLRPGPAADAVVIQMRCAASESGGEPKALTCKIKLGYPGRAPAGLAKKLSGSTPAGLSRFDGESVRTDGADEVLGIGPFHDDAPARHVDGQRTAR